ncbi:MAG: ArsA family ATPase [Candidatus Marinimicrobia bacterium]|mgnify:FL=1|jgi:arsenite/tail-anchored protein-transporting ATPase|nr:ArsA family ATPase [Candidatus Neomarinimicrobiota bacterium]
MLILFTGKGGVGKSTMAATTAVYHAKQGKNTILVSSDPAHSTDDVILQKVGFSPTKIEENLWAMNINAEKQAKEFLERTNEGMKSLTANIPGFDSEILSDMAGFPGMEEYFGMEMIYNLMNDTSYDVIVFDTAPTGHTLKMLTAPDTIRAFILRVLRMKAKIENIKGFIFRKKSETAKIVKELEDICERIEIFKKLLREDDCSINLVSIPSEAGYQECARTIKFLNAIQLPIKHILVNNIIPDFGEDVWNTAEDNPAAAMTYRRYTIQQPYLTRYRSLASEHQVRLVGITLVPFEPMGLLALEKLSTLVWGSKGMV